MNWKIIEENGHTKEKKILYRGLSQSEAIKAYHAKPTLPFGEKLVYLGSKRVYPYQLPTEFF